MNDNDMITAKQGLHYYSLRGILRILDAPGRDLFLNRIIIETS